MTSIVELIEVARSLVIEGTAAMDFAVSQQELEHEDREAKRLADKEAEADERQNCGRKTSDQRCSGSRRTANTSYQKRSGGQNMQTNN